MLHKYKNIFDDFIDTLDEKSHNWLKPIHKVLCNMHKFQSNSKSYLEKKDILNLSLWLTSKIEKF